MRTLSLTSAIVVVGCSGEVLPSPSQVRSLRVVALVTDTPEVAPGARVQVTAAWVDPTPGRTVRARWQLCDEREVPDPRACPVAATAVDLGEGRTVTTPALSRVGTYYVFVAACADAAPLVRRDLGHWRCADGTPAEQVFGRVRVTETRARNRPPAIAAVTLARGDVAFTPDAADSGVVLPGCDGGSCGPWVLRVRPETDAAEAIPDGGREALSVSFYVTSGSTDRPRDTARPGELRELTAQWTPGVEVRSEVWVVLRDQRGGETARGVTVTGSGR